MSYLKQPFHGLTEKLRYKKNLEKELLVSALQNFSIRGSGNE